MSKYGEDRAGLDPFRLTWNSLFQDHTYDPVYLANGMFGGMVDLSGTNMDLWSSQISCLPSGAGGCQAMQLPVTAIRLQAYYRSPSLKTNGFWVGCSGIHCNDSRYTSDPSMPHQAQVYDVIQSLNLREGMLETSGRICLGSHHCRDESRSIPFQSRVVFLKDSSCMGIEIEVDECNEVMILPQPILEEQFALSVSGKGVHRLGNELDCNYILRQSLCNKHVDGGSIVYDVEPEGGEAYQVRVHSPTAEIVSFGNHWALVGKGEVSAVIEIQILKEKKALSIKYEFEDLCRLQGLRWQEFWSQATITLPAEELLWQQRYHAGLFYVAQSMGGGATHPGGLSKPMLPYWRGCFHDTDTYFCRPLLERGHFKEAGYHRQFRSRCLDAAHEIATSFGQTGALYPWQSDNRGFGEAGNILVNSAIIACEAWFQYCYSGEEKAFVEAREILRATFQNLVGHLDWDCKPLCFKSSPLMTFSETMVAQDPTEARIALRAVAANLIASGCQIYQEKAQRVLAELILPVLNDKSYAIAAEGEPEYLRCPSVTLGSFPLHHLVADDVLAMTFDKELERILYLFAWLPHQASVVASQLQRSQAYYLLRHADSFYKTWHAYDEWENRRTARAANFVTAGGGFATAIHHMLLAETRPGEWSLFPGVPSHWRDLAFDKLRTRNGWTVSARMRDGRIQDVQARPTHADAATELKLIGLKNEEFKFSR